MRKVILHLLVLTILFGCVSRPPYGDGLIYDRRTVGEQTYFVGKAELAPFIEDAIRIYSPVYGEEIRDDVFLLNGEVYLTPRMMEILLTYSNRKT